ncbi:acyltransferase [soil metagenome]
MNRISWIDVAKGAAIVLIVLHHARDYALSLVPPSPEHVLRWAYIDPLLRHIRLPLFFLLSGMLASGMGSACGGFRARRSVSLALVYAGWSVVLLLLVPHWPDDSRHAIDPERLTGLLFGASPLWYLWATALAFAFAWATRTLASWMAVALACAAGLLLQKYGILIGGAFEVLGLYLPFYCLGACYPRLLTRLAAWRSPRGGAILLGAYGLSLSPVFDGPGIDLLRSLLGVGLGLAVAGLAAERWPRATAGLGWLGRRTLPIYILHFPIIALLCCAAVRQGAPLAWQSVAISLFAPLLTALTIALSLALFGLIRAAGAGWLFAMPLSPPQRRRFSATAG